MHFLFGELVGVQFMEQLDATLRAHSVLANYYGFGFQGKDFATESTAWKLLINYYGHSLLPFHNYRKNGSTFSKLCIRCQGRPAG